MKQLIQIPNKKNLWVAFVALIITATASAQQFEDPLIKVKKIDLVQPFNGIEVRGDAVIVLTNNLTSSVVLRGEGGNLESATVIVKKGKLIVNVSKNYNESKFIVYLPAGSINSLATSGRTRIISSGTIRVSDLEILLNGASQVSIHHEGKLKITPGSGYEIVEGM